MVKATKKIIKKFTKATHGHPLFIKILFENLTFFTQGNGITRFIANGDLTPLATDLARGGVKLGIYILPGYLWNDREKKVRDQPIASEIDFGKKGRF